MKPVSREKTKAQKKYWGHVQAVQDEFCRQFIHEGLSVREVVMMTHMTPATVRRFFHRGEAMGKRTKSIKPYSHLHGPFATTVFGIADALGMKIRFQNGSGK